MSTVYRAKSLILEREVALKVLSGSATSGGIKRFQQEAKTMGQLRHPNAVSIFSFDYLDDDTPVIVMEFLEGQSLQRLLEKQGRLSLAQVNSLLAQLCAGLDAAHRLGIVHRDLSSSNIFLVGSDTDFVVKILDFGISKIVNRDKVKDTLSSGKLVGTPFYMSPEQAEGGSADARSDIYSLGCVLYECLCGRKAFDADNGIALIHAQLSLYPPEPDFAWGDKSKERVFRELSVTCLQKDPERRFQSCSEILSYLASPEEFSDKLERLDRQTWSSSRLIQSSLPADAKKMPWQLLAGLSIFLIVVSFFVCTAPDCLRSAALFFESKNKALALRLMSWSGDLYLQLKHDPAEALDCDLILVSMSTTDHPQLITALDRLQQQTLALPDSKQKCQSLIKAFNFVDKLNYGKYITEVENADYKSKFFAQLVHSKYCDRLGLRKDFSALLEALRPVNRKQSSANAQLAWDSIADFLEANEKIKLDQSETDRFEYLPREILNDKGLRIIKDELKREPSSVRAKMHYALCLQLSAPLQARVLLRSIMNDPAAPQDARILSCNSLIDMDGDKLLGGNDQKSYQFGKIGLSKFGDVSALSPEKTAMIHRMVRLEYRLKLQKEMESLSRLLVHDLVSANFRETNITTIDIMSKERNAGRNAERNAYLEQNWLPTYNVLTDTNQGELARELAEDLQRRCQEPGWKSKKAAVEKGLAGIVDNSLEPRRKLLLQSIRKMLCED